ncbi:MAG: transcription factor S [archaeon]
MKFCPKCKSLLKPLDKTLCCACGYAEKKSEELTITEKLSSKKKIEIINEDDEFLAYPSVPVVCRKCGGKEAVYWLVQTRRSDEPPTRFFKCKSCRRVWKSGN